MENKAHALAAGIFVVVVTALLVALAAWLTRDTGERDIYEISTRETVTGLQAAGRGALSRRRRGQGRLDRLRSEGDGQRADAPGDRPRGAGDARHLRDAELPGRHRPGLRPARRQRQAGAARWCPTTRIRRAFRSSPACCPSSPTRGEVILDQVEKVTGRMNELLGDANQQRVASALDNLGSAAADAGRLAQRLDTTLAKRVDPALAEAPVTMRSVQRQRRRDRQDGRRLRPDRAPPERKGRADRSAGRGLGGAVACRGFVQRRHPAAHQPGHRGNLARGAAARPHGQCHQRQPAVADLRHRARSRPGRASPASRRREVAK